MVGPTTGRRTGHTQGATSMQSHFGMFARYNEWANRRLYACAAALSNADYRADRGAFFASVHGTLNHLLLADRIWMNRFTGQSFGFKSLDQELYSDFAQLRAEREKDDNGIIAWVEPLTLKV